MTDTIPEVTVDEKEECIRFRGKYISKVKRVFEILRDTPENERKYKLVKIIGFESLNDLENYDKYYHPQKGDIVLDAGAHVGVTVQRFSEMVGDEGLVLAVEPDFRAIGMLTHNVADLNNVKILPYALWDDKDVLAFHYFDASGGVGMGSMLYQFQYWCPVRAITFDELLKTHDIKKVDFIKMDIEGSEIHALEGMSETLKHIKGAAIAAYHKIDNDGTKSYPRVIEILEEAGLKTKLEMGCDGEIVYAFR